MYTSIIVLGLVVVFLMFAHFKNETRAQIAQIRTAFDHLLICAYTTPCTDETIIESLSGSECEVVFRIASNSITCGKKMRYQKHQIDFPVETADDSLVGTAAEFVVEPDGDRLCLYVRALEQPYIWVCSKDRDYLAIIMNSVPKKRNDENKWVPDYEKLPSVPPALRCKTDQVRVVSKKKKISLHLGDKILMGNTLFEIKYEEVNKAS